MLKRFLYFVVGTFADPGHGVCELVTTRVAVDDFERCQGDVVEGSGCEMDDLM